MAHQHQLLRYSAKHSRGIQALRIAFNNAVEDGIFVGTLAKEEHTTRRMLPYNHLYHLFEHLRRIHFLLVSREGCNANPLLKSLLYAYFGRKKAQVAALGRKDRGEIHLYGIAQLGKNVGIVLESRRQRHQPFVCLCHQFLAFVAVFVDMFHPITPKVEPQSQIARAQHIVQVGHGSDVLSNDALVQLV